MKKLAWSDYQMAQNRDDFEVLEKETLEALSIVCPPPIKGEIAQGLYDNSQQRILRRLAQLEEERKARATNWAKISALITLGALAAIALRWLVEAKIL